MGCVLTKRATSDHNSKPSSATHNVEQVVCSTELTTKAKDEAANKINHSITEVPGLNRRKPKPVFTLKTNTGWPSWLCDVAADALKDWTPRRANTFEKIDKIGQGTYSNVYKAGDLITGKIVALKKVRFDNLEPESVKFMAREILILKKLNHPNIIKLQGLVTSRMSCSLYLIFEYMEHDLSGLAAIQGVKFTEPQDIRNEGGRPISGSTLFPQSIRPNNSRPQPGRISSAPGSVDGSVGNGVGYENGNYSNGYLLNRGVPVEDQSPKSSKLSSEIDIYESSRYDAILLKEDLKNTSWLHSADDKSDKGLLFDHGFETLPEPFGPL